MAMPMPLDGHAHTPLMAMPTGTRAAVAVGYELRGSPPGQFMAAVAGQLIASTAPLAPLAAVALVLAVVRSLALGGGFIPWATRRPRGGRKLRGVRRRAASRRR